MQDKDDAFNEAHQQAEESLNDDGSGINYEDLHTKDDDDGGWDDDYFYE